MRFRLKGLAPFFSSPPELRHVRNAEGYSFTWKYLRNVVESIPSYISESYEDDCGTYCDQVVSGILASRRTLTGIAHLIEKLARHEQMLRSGMLNVYLYEIWHSLHDCDIFWVLV